MKRSNDYLFDWCQHSFVFSFLLILFFFFTLSSCAVYKTLRYGGIPNQNDYKHFAQRKIDNEGPVFYFKRPITNYKLGTTIDVVNRELNSTNINLDSFVNIHNTIAFLIIRNDTILYEQYKDKYTDTSLVTSFSMVKPMLSTLIGIAIDEGKIKSKKDFIIKYLPEFQGKAGWDKITIEHLLHHTSGIKFTDNMFNPVSDNAQYYWGNNLRKEIQKLTLECPPGIKFKYSSANALLLSKILEHVTGGTISHYLEEKIWKPLGMEAPAFWSLDRKDEKAIEKSFCCLQARAIDFAKFGRLYLNNGNWNGKQIVSSKWVEYSTHSDPKNGNKHFFHNNWGIGPLKYGSYYAVGLYGQYLYIYPEKKIMIIRFGKAETPYYPDYWSSIFLQIIDQL